MKNIKIILKSIKEIIITYILQYLIIFILCIIYTLLGNNNLNHFINNYCTYILLLYYIIVTIYLYKKNKTHINSTKLTHKNIYLSISTGISIALFLNMIIFKITNITNTRTIPLSLAIISSGLIGPIYEEILFRHILYNKLTKHYNNTLTIIITTIIFSVIHINPIKIIYTFLLGLIITISYSKTKNILIPILIHISANTIVVFINSFNSYILILSIFILLINIMIIKNSLLIYLKNGIIKLRI